jgi:hypothetical protein
VALLKVMDDNWNFLAMNINCLSVYVLCLLVCVYMFVRVLPIHIYSNPGMRVLLWKREPANRLKHGHRHTPGTNTETCTRHGQVGPERIYPSHEFSFFFPPFILTFFLFSSVSFMLLWFSFNVHIICSF